MVLLDQRFDLRQKRQGFLGRGLVRLGVEPGGLQPVERSLADQLHPPGTEEEVIQQFCVDRRLLFAGFEMLDRRLHHGQEPLGRFPDRGGRAGGLEVVLPEPLVVHPLHAGHAVRLAQQLDRPAEVVLLLSKQHRADSPVEIVGRGGRGVPRAFRPPGMAVPLVALQSLTVVLPGRVEHADRPVLGPVADKVADVERGGAEVGQDPAPVADSRTDEELVAGIGERDDLIFKAQPGAVTPGEHDGVFGDLLQMVGMLEDDVAPHHHPLLVLVFKKIIDPADMPDVHAAHADLVGQLLRRPRAQAPRFIAADVEKLKRHERADLGVDVVQQLVRLLLDRTQQRRCLAQMGVLLVGEYPREVAERLLVAEDVDVVLLAVVDQCLEIGRLERAVFRPDERMLLERVLILHVVGEQVHLQVRTQGDLELERIERGAGAAGHVVLEAPPAERGPVEDLQARQLLVAAIGTDELADRLGAVEQPFAPGSGQADLLRIDGQVVVLIGRFGAKPNRRRASLRAGRQPQKRAAGFEAANLGRRKTRPLELGGKHPPQQVELIARGFQGQPAIEREAARLETHPLGKRHQPQVRSLLGPAGFLPGEGQQHHAERHRSLAHLEPSYG